VSVGAASAVGPGSVSDLYPRADAALYAAKAAGSGLLRIAR
jgi:predicted signal transduction protein with EAL and GGDEF domain